MTCARLDRACSCILLAIVLATCSGATRAAEVCRYAGGGDYQARIGIITTADRHGPDAEVRVLWNLTARALLIFHIHYRVEEISRWRAGVLQTLGLNVRAFVNGRIIKQQWDLFERTDAGFAAWRMQAKTASDFAARYGAFAAHWDQASFGAPWLDAYHTSHAERAPISTCRRLTPRPGLSRHWPRRSTTFARPRPGLRWWNCSFRATRSSAGLTSRWLHR